MPQDTLDRPEVDIGIIEDEAPNAACMVPEVPNAGFAAKSLHYFLPILVGAFNPTLFLPAPRTGARTPTVYPYPVLVTMREDIK